MQGYILERSSWVGNLIVTAVLWLTTSFIAFWEILLIRSMGIDLYLRFANNSIHVPSSRLADQANVIGQIFVIIGGMIAIAIVPGSVDFHYRHFGTLKSWRMFAYVLCFQLVVFMLTTLI